MLEALMARLWLAILVAVAVGAFAVARLIARRPCTKRIFRTGIRPRHECGGVAGAASDHPRRPGAGCGPGQSGIPGRYPARRGGGRGSTAKTSPPPVRPPTLCAGTGKGDHVTFTLFDEARGDDPPPNGDGCFPGRAAQGRESLPGASAADPGQGTFPSPRHGGERCLVAADCAWGQHPPAGVAAIECRRLFWRGAGEMAGAGFRRKPDSSDIRRRRRARHLQAVAPECGAAPRAQGLCAGPAARHLQGQDRFHAGRNPALRHQSPSISATAWARPALCCGA